MASIKIIYFNIIDSRIFRVSNFNKMNIVIYKFKDYYKIEFEGLTIGSLNYFAFHLYKKHFKESENKEKWVDQDVLYIGVDSRHAHLCDYKFLNNLWKKYYKECKINDESMLIKGDEFYKELNDANVIDISEAYRDLVKLNKDKRYLDPKLVLPKSIAKILKEDCK